MNARQIAEANAILGANDYSATLATDFTHTPPTRVDEKFAFARAMITTAIADLGGKQGIQSGAGYRAETSQQRILREGLEDHLGDINFTISAIAAEKESPALKSRFRMPNGHGDTELAATALGMAAAIRELGLNDELESHGYPADTAAFLEDLVEEFKASEGGQGRTLGDQAGATASIPTVLRSGKTAMKILTSIFNRVYKGNDQILTGWETASHIERAPKRSKEPVAPPARPTV